MSSDLEGRVVLITGGASGLGRAIAVRLGRGGSVPVIADVDDDGAAHTAALVEADGGTAEHLHLDITDREAVDATIACLADRYPSRFTGLINNAGIDRGASIVDIDDQDWARVVAVNQTAPLLLCRAFVRSLNATPRDRLADIVNVVSISAITVGTDAVAYNSSKAALAMLTRILQREALEHRWPVRVHGLMPSAMNTPMMSQWSLPDEVMMNPDTVASAVEFMLTLPEEAFVQNLVINSRREPNWPR